jgi:rubrerythrin
MTEGTMGTAEVVADLNDLLQLEHDAVQGYNLAIGQIEDAAHLRTLEGFRDDHQRHIEEISRLIRERNSLPVQLPHLPTGPMKAAMQALATPGGDREVLMAFKTNEGQVRDRYRDLVAKPYPAEVLDVLRRASEDEEVHYTWVLETLELMGAGPGTTLGSVQETVEGVQKRVADAVEGAGRRVMETVERLRPDRRD